MYVHRIKGVFNIKRGEGRKPTFFTAGLPGLAWLRFAACVRYDIIISAPLSERESSRDGRRGGGGLVQTM